MLNLYFTVNMYIAVLLTILQGFTTPLNTVIHTYIFIKPRSHVTIQDAKTVRGEIEKEAKKAKLNYLQQKQN